MGQFCPVLGYLQAVRAPMWSLDLGRQWEQGSPACTAVPHPSCLLWPSEVGFPPLCSAWHWAREESTASLILRLILQFKAINTPRVFLCLTTGKATRPLTAHSADTSFRGAIQELCASRKLSAQDDK